MLVDQNAETGIYVGCQGALVEHNQVVDTGGSTAATALDVIGIYADGPGSTLSNNMVSGLTATGGGEHGIATDGEYTIVRGNVVSDTATPTGGGTSFGIYLFQSIAVNNSISNFGYGIVNDGGIYAHNTAYNCTTPYFNNGGTAGAGNSP